MISGLVDRLPDSVTVRGKRYPIRTDFRAALLFELLLDEKTLPAAVKMTRAIRLFYPGKVPDDAGEAFQAIVDFLRGEAPCGRGAQSAPTARLLDFAVDWERLFAAFYDQYGIDLCEVQGLHIYKFRALLCGLREDHAISRVMRLRAMDLSAIKDKKERARLSRLKERFRIEGGEPPVDAGAAFAGGLAWKP